MQRLLVATSQYFGICRTIGNISHVAKIHEGAGVYTGITWNNEYFYVLATRNAGTWKLHGSRGSDNETVLVFDSRLRYQGEASVGTRDGHWLHYDSQRDVVLVADTAHDRISAFHPATAEPAWEWPAPQGPRASLPHQSGSRHVNCVWTDRRGRGFVLARGAAPRQALLWEVDFNNQAILGARLLRPEAHAAFVHNGVHYLASFDGMLCCQQAYGYEDAIELYRGYARGLAYDHRAALRIAGISARGPREIRHFGDATIETYVGSLLAGRAHLRGAGQIYCLRSIDNDVGHQGEWGARCPIETRGFDEALTTPRASEA